MSTVNLHTSYKQPLVQAFEFASILAGKTSTEFEWRGNNAIVLTDIVTDALNDYDRTTSSNRYGTPSEVADQQQILTLQKDRSFSKTVDKGNYQEANYLKTGAAVIKAYMNEQVGPEMEQFVLGEFAAHAGTKQGVAAPTTSTILATSLGMETAMDDARVPKQNRFCALPHAYVAMLRQSLINCDNITDKMLLKGVVGKIGSLHILGVSSLDMPTDTYAIAWQEKCVAVPILLLSKVAYWRIVCVRHTLFVG